MDDHFKAAPLPARKPDAPGAMSGWLATLALLAAVGGSVYAAIRLSSAPVAEAVEASAPARQPAPVVAASVAKPAPAAPKGLADMVERVVESRRARAAPLRWLDDCEQKQMVPQARSAIAASTTATGTWNAEVRLNNLLANIKDRQQDVGRLNDQCDGRERRLVGACRAAGYTVPVIENPQTTWNGDAARERKRPQLHTDPPTRQSAAPSNRSR
ncbi:MAG: hypothetical protein H0W72_02965 [Planctomycetes bacterium]|nr:hypothetical protein [Planctomycetota bacterium]